MKDKSTNFTDTLVFKIITYVLVAILSACVALIIYIEATKIRPTSGTEKLAQIQAIIQERYIGTYDETEMIDAAAAGMVEGIGDRWSYYVSAEELKSYTQHKENKYVGIGVTIEDNDDPLGFRIVAIEPDSPAMQAGILPGDILYSADGQLMRELGLDGSGDVIGGKAGTTVTIGVQRPADNGGYTLLEFVIERATIQVKVAQGQLLENDIGYIQIANFNDNCAHQTVMCIEQLMEEGAKALVFDVRFNGGGYKHELVELLDYLLPEGDLFISEAYTGEVEIDTSDADCLEMPMAVLVNGSSYSAAEFFAAALEEYDWAILGGAPTTGKGYFQVTCMLSDGSALNLSVGKYYTPNRVCLADVGGLVPEYAVEVDDETNALIYGDLLEPADDPQLQAVIAVLLEQIQ